MANNVDFAKLELNFLSYLNMLIDAIIFIIELLFNRHLNSVAHQNIQQNILILSLSDKTLLRFARDVWAFSFLTILNTHPLTQL